MSLRNSDNVRHVMFAPIRRESTIAINFAPPQKSVSYATNQPSDDQRFIDWVLRQAGLAANYYQHKSQLRRLPAILRALRVSTSSQAKSAIQRNKALLNVALDSLLLGVTRFFRDPEIFSAIDDLALADLCRRTDRIRIWSVGCSTGAELYSTAILLAEQKHLHRSLMLGTDCRQSAIDVAATGKYPANALVGVAPELLSRYFTSDKSNWALDRRLIDACRWQRANVLGEGDFGLWDLILCRNTAMYLTVEAATLLWRRLESALSPGGFLIVGSAEQPRGTSRLETLRPCIYRKARG